MPAYPELPPVTTTDAVAPISTFRVSGDHRSATITQLERRNSRMRRPGSAVNVASAVDRMASHLARWLPVNEVWRSLSQMAEPATP
jgi:hypothetical protein